MKLGLSIARISVVRRTFNIEGQRVATKTEEIEMDKWESQIVNEAIRLLDKATVEIISQSIPKGSRREVIRERVVEAISQLELLNDPIRLDEDMGIIEIARSWFQHYPSDIFINGEVAEIRRQFACLMIRRHKTRMGAK